MDIHDYAEESKRLRRIDHIRQWGEALVPWFLAWFIAVVSAILGLIFYKMARS